MGFLVFFWLAFDLLATGKTSSFFEALGEAFFVAVLVAAGLMANDANKQWN